MRSPIRANGALNDATCCAERNLARKALMEARRHGKRGESARAFVRRKLGVITVVRRLHDGSFGCSLPCLLCRRALDGPGRRWRAYFDGRWIDTARDDLPASKLTGRQRRDIASSV